MAASRHAPIPAHQDAIWPDPVRLFRPLFLHDVFAVEIYEESGFAWVVSGFTSLSHAHDWIALEKGRWRTARMTPRLD